MTNKEILQADILDILFENRNKEYGAYALRRHYNNRLSLAIGIVLAVVFFTIVFAGNNGKGFNQNTFSAADADTVTVIEMPKEKPKEPEPVIEKREPAEILAQVKSTDRIEIVPDHTITQTDVPEIKDLAEKIISDKTTNGDLPKDPNITLNNTVEKGDGTAKETETQTVFKPEERAPEFPGGREALARFFSRNLNTPDDLEPGDKKIILVRFVVDIDGAISRAEVIQSGGDKYDKEVLRVFKKMPRWKPAIQNGHTVAVNFTQPVTFVGVEE